MATDRYTIELTIEGNDRASTDLHKINRELDNLDENSKGAKDGMTSLGNAITGAGLLLAAQEIGRQAGELQKLGAEASSSREVFEQLAGGTEQAAQALQLMRSNTGGIVDDLTLMQGANSLLLTGLAETTTEAADLAQVAVRLGAAMGQDAAGSIENFNAALLNNSFARLDTLGISAAAVRERVAELKEEGLDMSAAFAQATLEQGQAALLELGDAATASETSVNRATTAYENARIKLGELLNQAAETGAQLLILTDIAAGGDGLGSLAGNEIFETQQIAERNLAQRGGGLASGNVDVNQAVNFAQENPDLFNQIVSSQAFTGGGGAFDGSVFTGIQITEEEILAVAEAFGFSRAEFEASSLAGSDLQNVFNAVADAQSELAGESEALATSTEQVAASNEKNAEALQQGEDAQDSYRASTEKALEAERILEAQKRASYARDEERHAAQRAAAAERQALAQQEIDLFEAQDAALAGLQSTFEDNSIAVGDNVFFDPADVESVVSQADELQARAEEIAQLAEDTDFEFITQDEVSAAQALADEARTIADEATRAAEALEAASLSELFGQTGGGRQGEIFDAVLANIDDEDTRARAQEQFDLASGRTTEVSNAFESEFAPIIAAIAEEFGANAAIAAAQRFDEATLNSTAAGLSQDEIIAAQQQALGFTLAGGGTPSAETTVQAGEGRNAVANRLGVSVQELNQTIGADTVLQPGQVISIGDGQRLVAINESDISTFDTFTDKTGDVPVLQGGTAGREVDPTADPFATETAGSDPFSQENVTNAEGIAVSSEAIATNWQTVYDLDLGTTLDDFNADIIEADVSVTGVLSRLQEVNTLDLRAEVPLALMLDNQTGLSLAPLVREQIILYLEETGQSAPTARSN